MYVEYTKDGVYVANGEYGEYAKEDASIEEGHNKPLAKEGDDKSLAKDGKWAGYNNEPLGMHTPARQQQAPCHNM
jgi:hypothetical protein